MNAPEEVQSGIDRPPYGRTWQNDDVVSGPGETRDLAEESPEKRSGLIVAWDSYARDIGVILTE